MAEEEPMCTRYLQAANLISKRWTPLILRVLLVRPRHYSEIARGVGNISDRVLSIRLKELEEEEIIQRKVFAEIPVRIEYTLTAKGRALNEVVEAIERWGSEWLPLPEEQSPQPEKLPKIV
ncbi:winged helix-turn-helix transcriptional regulator [Dictyobacter kobayashii]|uniref:HxlR family transcriptional regulator n=1 Tax=Dictyobacter kobayashii TaxID=2014872 RepID=A0A402AUX5_9CHLR|nr:helix-turn-helix domain-containing protein [Dictyobacter kobayashii]GCE22859.1 HxlR family transcriptional regulator [Dictyobacter kobayashii]